MSPVSDLSAALLCSPLLSEQLACFFKADTAHLQGYRARMMLHTGKSTASTDKLQGRCYPWQATEARNGSLQDSQSSGATARRLPIAGARRHAAAVAGGVSRPAVGQPPAGLGLAAPLPCCTPAVQPGALQELWEGSRQSELRPRASAASLLVSEQAGGLVGGGGGHALGGIHQREALGLVLRGGGARRTAASLGRCGGGREARKAAGQQASQAEAPARLQRAFAGPEQHPKQTKHRPGRIAPCAGGPRCGCCGCSSRRSAACRGGGGR